MGHGSVNCFLLKDSVIYKANKWMENSCYLTAKSFTTTLNITY